MPKFFFWKKFPFFHYQFLSGGHRGSRRTICKKLRKINKFHHESRQVHRIRWNFWRVLRWSHDSGDSKKWFQRYFQMRSFNFSIRRGDNWIFFRKNFTLIDFSLFFYRIAIKLTFKIWRAKMSWYTPAYQLTKIVEPTRTICGKICQIFGTENFLTPVKKCAIPECSSTRTWAIILKLVFVEFKNNLPLDIFKGHIIFLLFYKKSGSGCS